MLEVIKKLRQQTGAGMVDIKKALEEAGGDEAKAIELLRKQGSAKAVKKADREAREGVISSYVHSNMRVGVIVKLLCETDFVARNEDFQQLGRDIAMHVAAMNPQYVRPEEVPAEVVAKEQEIWREQLASEGKPEAMLAKIMEGKEKKFREEAALLTQPFVKDPAVTIGDLIAQNIGKIGENIQIGGFSRLEL
ncbi:MAG TPA: translation elongation factor Ts [Candidatus Moranbacteria bacterium]|nr:translation elongation factor Ts [Candidatus Moranbacteria bacterium]